MPNDTKSKKPATDPARQNRPAGKNKQPNVKLLQVRRSLRTTGRYAISFSRSAADRFTRFVEQEDMGDLRLFGLPLHFNFRNGAIIALCVLLIAYLLFTNMNIVTEEQSVTVVGASADFEGYRILHISDMHGRDYGESLQRAIEQLKYDIVLVSGDMVGVSDNPEPFYQMIEAIGDTAPIYFIAGDSDPGPLVDTARPIEGTLNQLVLEDWILGATDRGAIYLNKPVSLEVGASKLWLSPGGMLNVNADKAVEAAEYELALQKDGVLGGIDSDYNYLPFTNYRYRQCRALKEATLYMEESDLHILLSHYPPNPLALESAQANVSRTENAYLAKPDLAFCGHYCGGVWRIPLIGAFYIPDALAPRRGWLPRQELVSGIRTSSSTVIHTSPGLGATDYGLFMDFRLFNAPKITLITLTTQLTEDLLAG